MSKYSVIDLFAGAGGLSLGFIQADQFDIKVAFENNPCMQQTYKNNHPGVEVQGDVCAADYAELQHKYGNIDVVIGGPPCQGFSNANRQKNHAISKNNMLVKQYLRAILELRPKAFLMENVSMLRSEVHRFYMEERDLETVERCSIPVKTMPLHLIDAEYVFGGALNIIQDPSLIRASLWPENDYAVLNVIFKAGKNIDKMRVALRKHQKEIEKISYKYLSADGRNYISKVSKNAFGALVQYYFDGQNIEELQRLIAPAVMIQRMLSKAKEIHDNHIVVDSYDTSNGISAMIRSFAVFDYIKGILGSPEIGYVINSSVLCAADYGAPQKRKRFIVVGIQKAIAKKIALPNGVFDEDQYHTVRDAIADLEDVQPVVNLDQDQDGITLEKKDNLGELARSLRDSAVLRNHIITRTTDTAMERFKALKQGENFHALSDEMKENTYTDVSRTQNTIYLRLDYDEPSGTVVNVRKSMWIHPTLDRAISVREAARLQTFPDSFVFYGTKDKQYQQVGNAVPPIMAKAIAVKLAQTLNDNLS